MSGTSSATSAASRTIRRSSSYVRELYQVPGIAETVDMDHIKKHYYQSHRTINPTGVVPVGPIIDLASPGTRGF